MAKDQFVQNVKSFKALFKSVQAAASSAADASYRDCVMQAHSCGRGWRRLKPSNYKTTDAWRAGGLRASQEAGSRPRPQARYDWLCGVFGLQDKVTSASGQKTGQATAPATVHFASSPTGGEIDVDGKFFGNTPSDISSGEHAIKITAGGKEWSRSGSGSSTLTVSTNRKTPRGSFVLTITGSAGSLVHSATVTLVVQ
jgi:hypothetical protein